MSDCPTNVLADSPASTDAFGSHEPIASALAEMIVGDEGGRSVALEGRWGSGKSSVIGFLKEKLQQRSEDQYGVFLFDAWAHRGDPLRRSFLEELVAYFRGQGWAEEGDWSDELDRLSRRKEHHHIEREPVLTTPGKFVAVSLLLTPVGYAVTAAAFGWLGFNWRIFGAGLLLALLPAIIAGLAKLAPSTVADDQSYLSLFINQTQDRIKRTKVRTPNPTSIEFHSIFQRVLSEVLGSQKRTLVVAVDNLDRIEAEEALDIWSTMRTFFEFRQMSGSAWSDQLWLIVPFDRSGLEKLWSEEIVDADGSSEEPTSERAVDAFLEKSFQVRYHVPPPVTSGWRKYFRDELGQALPKHQDADQQYRISRIYEINRQSKDKDITPRDVKLFINDLGAVHRQWCETIPLAMQALYVTHREILESDRDVLEDPEFVDDKVKRLVGVEEWQKYLAALHFNVEPSEAMQVWMGSRVEELIVAREKKGREELRQLSKTPGFGQICERIIEDSSREWVRSEPTSLTAVANNIDRLPLEFESKAREERIWHSLKDSCLDVPKWDQIDREASRGLLEVLQRVPADDYVRIGKSLLANVRDSIPVGEDDGGGDLTGWISAYSEITSHLTSGDIDVSTVTYVPGDPSTFVRILRNVDEEVYSKDVSRAFVPEGPWAPVVDYLAQDIREHGLGTADLTVLRHFVSREASDGWEEIQSALQDRLRQGNNEPDADELTRALEALIVLVAAETLTADDLKGMSREPAHLGHRLHQLHQQSEKRGIAGAVVLMLLVNPEAEVSSHAGQSSQGLQHYNTIADTPSEYSEVVSLVAKFIAEYEVLSRLLTDEAVTRRAIIYEILKYYTDQGTAGRVFDPVILYEQWDGLRSSLGSDTFGRFVRQIVAGTDVIKYVMNEEFDPLRSTLYLELMEGLSEGGNAELEDGFQLFLFEGLSALDAEEWENALRQEKAEVELARRLLPGSEERSLGEEFLVAIDEYRDAVASGGIEATSSDIGALLRFVERDQRRVFIKNTIDNLIYQTENIDGVLRLYGEHLFNEMEYIRSQADQVVRQLLRKIVEEGGEEALGWSVKLLEKEPSLLEEVAAGTREDFIDRLQRNIAEVEKAQDGDRENGEVEESARLSQLRRLFRNVSGGREPEEHGDTGDELKS